MKSAYELAMERLTKSAPVKKLNAQQKREIAELGSRYAAKVAEKELAATADAQAAEAAGDFDKAGVIRQRLAAERAKLQAELDAKKDAVRGA